MTERKSPKTKDQCIAVLEYWINRTPSSTQDLHRVALFIADQTEELEAAQAELLRLRGMEQDRQQYVFHVEGKLLELTGKLRLRAGFVLQESFDLDLKLMKQYAEKSYETGHQFEANALWHAYDELIEFQAICRMLAATQCART